MKTIIAILLVLAFIAVVPASAEAAKCEGPEDVCGPVNEILTDRPGPEDLPPVPDPGDLFCFGTPFEGNPFPCD